MSKTGIASLPLHGGHAPKWLAVRMRKLAKEIANIMIEEFGVDLFLRRLSDPFWFQAFGCVLGYDWHSSGVTTVVTGILKQALSPKEHGIAVCGGKGRTSRKAPDEISAVGEVFHISEEQIARLRHISRLTAKVDNSAIQAGYQLYHHSFFMTDRKWAVIQQGMDPSDRTARRYHWLSENVANLVVEPHDAIICDLKRSRVLDMTAKVSEGSRKASVDLAKETPRKLMSLFETTRPAYQKSLQPWLPKSEHQSISTLEMPRRINWKALQRAYEFQPRNYEELLSIRGVGPSTIRGLALIAEMIYGEAPSWDDPVKFSFAYGGKDGVPFPVDRKAMDESIHLLRQTVQAARLGDKEKQRSLQRLRQFVPETRYS